MVSHLKRYNSVRFRNEFSVREFNKDCLIICLGASLKYLQTIHHNKAANACKTCFILLTYSLRYYYVIWSLKTVYVANIFVTLKTRYMFRY